MNKIAFDRARVHVETTVDILAECNDVQDKLRNLVEKKDFLVSLKVAFFGSLISQYMGNVSTKDYFKFNANSILDPQGHPVFAGVPYLEMTVTMIKSFLNFQEGFFDFSITLKRFVISSLGVYDLNILQALLMVFKQEEPQEVVEYQLSKLGDMV